LKSWRIEIKPSAEKQYLKLDAKTRQRIKNALRELEKEELPLSHPKVKPLTGKLKEDFRLRVGGWRVLFTPWKESKVIHAYAILPRGDAY
jgi:mRNA interferase RelE/StbE